MNELSFVDCESIILDERMPIPELKQKNMTVHLLVVVVDQQSRTEPKQFVSEQLNCFNDAIITIEIEANCALNQLNFDDFRFAVAKKTENCSIHT